MKLTYTITETEKFDNIKHLLKNKFEISDRLLSKLKNNNKIFLNNKSCNIKSSISSGDTIKVHLDFEEDNSNIVPMKMDLDILYEDDFLLIINKQPNLPVHPSILHYTDSLSNGIKYYFDSINLHKKIRPVNRLDRDTTGIVIFAKNEYIQECLVRQMKTDNFKKEYIAICSGIFNEKSGIINLPIARKENSIIERCVNPTGDNAITYYEVLKEFNNISIVKCLLKTGRTHQIRVHLSYLNHPILGDTLYGSSSENIKRQLLHAYKISFIHPIYKTNFTCTAPIPNDFLQLGYDNSIF